MTFVDEPEPRQPSNVAVRRARVPGRLGAPPKSLTALVLAVAIVGVAWALIVPPWQAPDEVTHFAYAQSLATRFALPGDPRRPLISSDQSLANVAVGAETLLFYVGSVRPDWSHQDFAQYLARARTHPSQSDGGGPNPQTVNPPLFYLYSDLAYWAGGGDNALGRLYAMRLWGVALLLTNVIAAWLLAGEVFAGRRLAQLVCAAVCGLLPMETFMSTSINPDALMVPLWTLALWLGTRLIRGGWRTRDATALCATTAAAILTKATSYALVPAVLVALWLGWHARPVPRGSTWRGVMKAAGALSALVAPVLAWVALTRSLGRSPVNTIQAASGGHAPVFGVRQFLSYIWQFYLPRLPFMPRFATTPDLAVFDVWLKGGWGTFGWLDVQLPAWIYPVSGAATAAVGSSCAAILIALNARRQRALLAFFVVALIALLFGLHLTAYRSIIAGDGPLLQGRYLLPVIGLFGLAVALVVLKIPERWRGATAGGILAALLVLQVVSLATVAKVYYT